VPAPSPGMQEGGSHLDLFTGQHAFHSLQHAFIDSIMAWEEGRREAARRPCTWYCWHGNSACAHHTLKNSARILCFVRAFAPSHRFALGHAERKRLLHTTFAMDVEQGYYLHRACLTLPVTPHAPPTTYAAFPAGTSGVPSPDLRLSPRQRNGRFTGTF